MLRLIALCAGLGLALPSAAAEVYQCRLAVTHNAVPEIVVVEIGPEGAEVAVNDPVIRSFAGGPIRARVAVDNARRTTFAWDLRIRTEVNQQATMSYRLTVLKPGLAATIVARPLGYGGTYEGRGRCSRVQTRATRRGA